MADFEVNDRRGRRDAEPGTSISRATANLRSRGFALPRSNVVAREIVKDVEASVHNRTLTAQMRKTGSVRTANVQMAIPKVREPLSSLKDKNIPFDTTQPDELIEIRKWARLFYSTHDLIPLLIDIYSKFPLVGLEFKSKDPQIKDFYESMFMDQLDYEMFLQDLGREYFISGEVNAFAHFDETLGVWSSEEILNPDAIRVSRSLFVDHERVQLMVKPIIDSLRSGTMADDDQTKSEQLEKSREYKMLVENYPEIIQAAQLDDGLDISDALISRIVNKVQPWDLRGTPHLLRSFRTLMMEESLNAAQDAVADRLYSPLILATLGIPNLGDGEPWIPDQADLDETRDMMQSALAADFRLLVHNFGLQVQSVFGRESVPRFDQDYARIDRKLMQAWGIGEALISGGTASTYASSALNREFVTQMMGTFQKAVKRHIRKRCEVIAEAQGHFDYEQKGGVRKPIFREIVEIDEETGEEYTRKTPKLLLPEVSMSTLNLRDETQERMFLQQLKQNGVPISDGSLSINIPIEFEEELEKQSQEKVEKIIAEAQAMKRAYDQCVEQGLPIPPDLARYMAATIQLQKERTDAETKEKEKDQLEQTGQMPGEQSGIPGETWPDGSPVDGENPNRAPEFGSEGTDPETGASAPTDAENPFGVDLDNSINQNMLDNTQPHDPNILPMNVPLDGVGEERKVTPLLPKIRMPRRPRTRPAESDEQRSTEPKSASTVPDLRQGRLAAKLSSPSTYGSVLEVDDRQIESSLDRLRRGTVEVRALVERDDFFDDLNRQAYRTQIRNDIDSIYLSVEIDRNGQARLASKADSSLKESFEVLCEMIDQFEEVYGYAPEW